MTKGDWGDGPAKPSLSDTEKKPRRPSPFKEEFIAQAVKLCNLGATDSEIADFFGVCRMTIWNWKNAHPDFAEAMELGKAIADARVERSLYQMAIGYEQEEVKIFMPAGADEPVYAPFRAKVAPSPTAAIFFLKNRRPDLWRDVHRQEHSGLDGKPIETITTTMTAKEAADRYRDELG